MSAIRDMAGLAMVLAIVLAGVYVAGLAGLAVLMGAGLAGLVALDPGNVRRAGRTGGQS